MQCMAHSELFVNSIYNVFFQVVQAMAHVLAPGQEHLFRQALFKENACSPPGEEDLLQSELLEACMAAYKNCTSWDSRRQILSIVAPICSLSNIQQYVPEVTPYLYQTALQHASVHGSGVAVTRTPYMREGVTQRQVEHFIDFILSPHISIEMPYGETRLKLSTGKTVVIEKVILSHVRSSVVNQYLEYCQNEEFVACSFRSYMRVLEALGPQIQKCMRGLDNYAADGAKAFDDLKSLSNDLVPLRPDGLEWASIVQEALTKGEHYLKLEYKVYIR